jgi:hypothetical protein
MLSTKTLPFSPKLTAESRGAISRISNVVSAIRSHDSRNAMFDDRLERRQELRADRSIDRYARAEAGSNGSNVTV